MSCARWEMAQILLCIGTPAADVISPCYNHWAPYLGHSRADKDVYNSEYKKVALHKGSKDEEENVDMELTEDLLIELMSEKKVRNCNNNILVVSSKNGD